MGDVCRRKVMPGGTDRTIVVRAAVGMMMKCRKQGGEQKKQEDNQGDFPFIPHAKTVYGPF